MAGYFAPRQSLWASFRSQWAKNPDCTHPSKGEETAQACADVWLRQLSVLLLLRGLNFDGHV
jgi:hypothetical protein